MPEHAHRTDPRTRRLSCALVVGALLLSGCTGAFSPRYYWQAAHGQFELWRRARPLDVVLADSATPGPVRDQLRLAADIRDWASSELSLPDNGSYRRYADLGRRFVVWNVFATEALSVKPRQSCFPVAGCVSYRGFFAEADARAHAHALAEAGLDVHVTGIPAYSTLGWFDDPLLNTFIHYPETELVRLIVHELAHQIVYVRDDTEFNESFASAVEEEGVRRWLARPGKAALQQGFDRTQTMRADFAALVGKYREMLDELYRSDLPDEAKRAGKHTLIGQLGADYIRLRDGSWNGFRGYDRWFGQDINNATLASIGLYTSARPAFSQLIARAPDLPSAWVSLRELAALPRDERRARLGLPPHPDDR